MLTRCVRAVTIVTRLFTRRNSCGDYANWIAIGPGLLDGCLPSLVSTKQHDRGGAQRPPFGNHAVRGMSYRSARSALRTNVGTARAIVESIAQRKDIDAASRQDFLTTAHQGLDNPKGMPTPNLAEFQVKAIVAYILSLRK